MLGDVHSKLLLEARDLSLLEQAMLLAAKRVNSLLHLESLESARLQRLVHKHGSLERARKLPML